MNQHPNPERLRQWLDGRLSEPESQEIYAHVTKCPDVCTTILDQLAKNKTLASDASMMTLKPGARPLPDYELVRKLGEGGFGEVWLGRGPGGIEAALKFIRLEARGSDLEVRSLDLMKSIRHPNLVSLFGAWQIDKVLILAMELCDRSLKDRLEEALTRNAPGIPIKELLNYMRDAANGLDALNEQSVQHRDVKPANLLLQRKGVKVADFGLAKVLEHSVASNTGAMTPAYTTPECFKGTVAKQSD
jgi:serine/threonine protein kinase